MTFTDACEVYLPRHRHMWLIRAIEILKWDFHAIGETIPEGIEVLTVFPDDLVDLGCEGCYRKVEYLAESVPTCRTIYITPVAGGLAALDILVHELVHATTDTFDHGEKFLATAAAIGLDDDGPTAAAERELLLRLQDIEECLGRYPMPEDLIGGPA